MKKIVFKGAGVAIVTPFNPDGSVNFDCLGRLIDFQIENGTDSIVVCGTTGECATLTKDERMKCVEFTVNRVNGRVPVVAGSGSNVTSSAVELTREVEKLGADAALVVTPYYNKASQEGLVRHYTAVADSTGIPLIVYNVPARTGVNVAPETYARLSKHPHINSIKEANGDLPALAKTIELCEGNINVYCGEDAQTVNMLEMGGIGVISVFSNICPKIMHDICALWLEGKHAESRSLMDENMELLLAVNKLDVNPIPIKTAVNMLGFPAGGWRLPLCEMSEAANGKLAAVMEKYGLAGR